MTDLGGILHAPPIALALLAGAAIVSLALSYLLYPLFLRYALARPNVRSSHRVPTPQGGGIAVVAAIFVTMALVAIALPGFRADVVGTVLTATIVLAIVGAADDIRPLSALLRLGIQSAVILVALYALLADIRIMPVLPIWLERTLLFFGLLWFVNLVNFMDGIDWMTVVEVVPISAALAVFGLLGALPSEATVIAITLCGAMLGFAPLNRPVARLFLGDVGSLPIGLLLGWLLMLLADKHLAAALLLPLYYLADATITLLRRLLAGEPVMQAHRKHFYQRALDAGLSVHQVIGRVFFANFVLVSLALLTIFNTTLFVQIVSLALGAAVVGTLLRNFSRNERLGSVGSR